MKLRFDPEILTRELLLSRQKCTPTLGGIYLDAVEIMSRGAQFRGYAFRAEMEGNALVALLGAARTFRPGGDPNGYIAQIIRRSFIGTIKREKARYANLLRLAADAGADISAAQLDWLRGYEAA